MPRWTDTTAYANLPNPSAASTLAITDPSAPEGSRQRTIRWDQITALLAAGATVESVDPTATDDETEGYGVGSLWFTSADSGFFICLDATADAAVWEELLVASSSGLATITTYATSGSLDETDDLDAYVRVTANATITLPNGFATGWQTTIVNASDAALVALAAAGTLVIPAGFSEEIVNRRAVTVIHVGSNVWEVHGALEASGSGS